jgi:hypothetical protein
MEKKMTDTGDSIAYGITLLVIFGMLFFPLVLSDMKREGSLGLYLNDYKNLPIKESSDGFILSFGIKNGQEDDVAINLILGREDEYGYNMIWNEVITIEPGESKSFIYPFNRTNSGKYTITVPQTGQNTHFWVFKNYTYSKPKAGPDLFPDTPWELQDPILQEYYRYN